MDKESGREGGTWFGLSTKGKVGVLLNILVNHPPDKSKKGRGFLVTDFLTSNEESSSYFQPFVTSREDYNGYNLILLEKTANSNRWTTNYFSNHEEESPYFVQPEIFGLSNSMLSRAWCKVNKGKAVFSTIVRSHQKPDQKSEMRAKLLELMNSKVSYLPDPVLEKQGENYLTEELVLQRSAVYVESPQINYGTRTNTVVIVDKDGQGEYTERTMVQPVDADSPSWSTKTFTFSV